MNNYNTKPSMQIQMSVPQKEVKRLQATMAQVTHIWKQTRREVSLKQDSWEGRVPGGDGMEIR